MLTKIARVSGIVLLTLLSTTAINNQSSYAAERKFFCAQSKGSPVTFARREDGAKIPMIRWVSSYSSFTPLQRCQEVSRRFQKNYDNDTLKTMITGTLNKQPVVCAAVTTNDVCTSSTMLFTLKPGTDPKVAVQRLFDRRGLAAGEIQNQSKDSTQVYIDFDMYLTNVRPDR